MGLGIIKRPVRHISWRRVRDSNPHVSLRSLGGGASPFLIFSPQYEIRRGQYFPLHPFGHGGSSNENREICMRCVGGG